MKEKRTERKELLLTPSGFGGLEGGKRLQTIKFERLLLYTYNIRIFEV